MSEKYDWVIASSDELPISAEGESVGDIFDGICVNLDNERLQDLERLRSVDGKRVSFVFT